MLSSFDRGARGLDYSHFWADPKASKLSVALVLFDFPKGLTDYTHCIGRTARPGQTGGRAVLFLAEYRYWIGRELVDLLQTCQQPVPPELSSLVESDEKFKADFGSAMALLREGRPICAEDGPVPCGGEFDEDQEVWILPATLPSYRRKLLHSMANALELPHVSRNTPRGRQLYIAREREHLGEKFFVKGEEVLVTAKGSSAPVIRQVADPIIHFRTRCIKVFGPGDMTEDVCVDYIDYMPTATPSGFQTS